MYTAFLIASAVFLVVLNGLFVAAEFSFVKIRLTRLEVLARDGGVRARTALFGRQHLDAYLSVCQLGITLSSLGLGWLGKPAVASLLVPLFELVGVTNQPLIGTMSVVIGFSIITFAHVVFGELAPKTISIRAAETTVLFLAVPMRIFYFVFFPAVQMLNAAALLTIRLMGAANLHSSEAHSTDELKMLIAESKAGGQLDEAEERFVNNIFNLDRRDARDIMVHRTRVKSLSTEQTVGDAIKKARKQGFTRFPLYGGGDKDNVLGFLHVKDLLNEPVKRKLVDFIRPAMSIYDHLPLDDVLEHMRRKNQQFGLVWDEYGSWQGLITMEDIIEVIVGELQDEFDHEDPKINLRADGSFMVDSTVSLDELKLYVTLNLGKDAEEHYRTLATILGENFRELPQEGGSVELYGARFTILDMDGYTISRILVETLATADSVINTVAGEKVAEKAGEKVAEKADEKGTEKADGKADEKGTEKANVKEASEKATEKASNKASNKANAKASEKGTDKNGKKS